MLATSASRCGCLLVQGLFAVPGDCQRAEPNSVIVWAALFSRTGATTRGYAPDRSLFIVSVLLLVRRDSGSRMSVMPSPDRNAARFQDRCPAFGAAHRVDWIWEAGVAERAADPQLKPAAAVAA